MRQKELTNSEMKFAEMIWERAPIASMELVRLSEAAFGWKKSTTFTVLKTLQKKGIIENKKAVVSIIMTRDEYLEGHSRNYIEDTFGGSLPKFLTTFMGRDRLSDDQAKELKRLIDEYKED